MESLVRWNFRGTYWTFLACGSVRLEVAISWKSAGILEFIGCRVRSSCLSLVGVVLASSSPGRVDRTVGTCGSLLR